MNLDELRKALASDATEKSKGQEKEIKRLHRQISDLRKENENLRNELEGYKDVLRAQFNRCYVLSGFGAMCDMCGHKWLCAQMKSTDLSFLLNKEEDTP